jgi:hypothetical protein
MALPKEKSLEGWGPFTFGISFDDALTAHSGAVWDAQSSRRCRLEMPVRGCTLHAATKSRFPLTAGVGLLPTLIFNQEGKLAMIRLRKFFKGDIEPSVECMSRYNQILDYLQKTWGYPTASSSNKHGMPKGSIPQGGEILPDTADGAVVGSETFQVQPDGRKIILQLRAVGTAQPGAAVCHLSIDYRGPDSLQPPPEERPHPLKNWN